MKRCSVLSLCLLFLLLTACAHPAPDEDDPMSTRSDPLFIRVYDTGYSLEEQAEDPALLWLARHWGVCVEDWVAQAREADDPSLVSWLSSSEQWGWNARCWAIWRATWSRPPLRISAPESVFEDKEAWDELLLTFAVELLDSLCVDDPLLTFQFTSYAIRHIVQIPPDPEDEQAVTGPCFYIMATGHYRGILNPAENDPNDGYPASFGSFEAAYEDDCWVFYPIYTDMRRRVLEANKVPYPAPAADLTPSTTSP